MNFWILFSIVLVILLLLGLLAYLLWSITDRQKRKVYIKVDYYKNDGTKSTRLIKPSEDNKTINVDGKVYMINPEHVFMNKGYRYISITASATETFNPLKFTSKYPQEHFTTAINSKIIKQTLETTEPKKLDLTQLIMFGNLAVTIILLYLMLKSQGVL